MYTCSYSLKEVSDPGTKEDLLIFLFFNTLVIYHVFTHRSNKCTSKPLFSQTLPLIEFGLPPPPTSLIFLVTSFLLVTSRKHEP